MSTENEIPPIQPAPARHFTLRLINGRFVRIPKVDNIALTDATRPASVPLPEASPHGDGVLLYRGLRLVGGRFVNGAASASAQNPPTPVNAANFPDSPMPPDLWE